MSHRLSSSLMLTTVLAACGGTDTTAPPELAAQFQRGGFRTLTMPDQDPGPPFYARVGLQFLASEGWLAIPFYRPPSCVPADFNLLEFYHFPGPGGPGAFLCPLNMTGTLLIEPDAPLGTFPKTVSLTGDNVPVWFVPEEAFMAAAGDGTVTMAELSALNPLRGTATHYHETLKPREEDHQIVITSGGHLEDGRKFTFNLNHRGTEIVTIRIAFR